MTERLNIIFNEIPICKTFADIGCDHGYIAQAMLKSGKAEKVIISDISQKCLDKAQKLLQEYIDLDRAKSIVSNGFEKIDFCDVALIAGMGGEEICSILLNAKFLPDILILQPMKNVDKVRQCAINLGYKIQKDFMFKSSQKFYDLIKLERGKDQLSDQEIEFGRDNICQKNEHFIEFINLQIERITRFLECENLSLEDREKMLKKREKLQKYV